MAEPLVPRDPAIFEGPNPFRDRIVGDPWAPIEDAPSIHARAGEQVHRLVRETANDRRTRLCLLTGDSGAGKSHLLGRLRRWIASDGFFAFVEPYVRPDGALRHIARTLIDSLWRPNGAGPRPLERFMDEVLLLAMDRLVDGDPDVLDEICRRFEVDVRSGDLYRDDDRARSIPFFLEQAIPDAARGAGRATLVALAATRRAARAADALDWLRGKDLDPEDLAGLGLEGGAAADEESARRGVAALAGLIGGAGPLVLCFDQTESLPPFDSARGRRDERGAAGLAGLLRLLDDLRRRAGNLVLIVTCLGEVLRAAGAEVRADLRVDLPGLDERAARALVAARVAPRLGPAAPPPEGFPFPDRFYAALGGRAAARDVLAAAAREWERLKAAAAAAAQGAPLSVPHAPAPNATLTAQEDAALEHWRAVWDEAERRAAGDPPPSDYVLDGALATYRRWSGAMRRDLHVEFSEVRDGRSFVPALKRLARMLETGEARRALLVRRAPIPERWQSAPEALEALGRSGGLLVGLDARSERILRAVRRLELKANAGDIRRPDGTAAAPEEVPAALVRAGAIPPLPVLDLPE